MDSDSTQIDKPKPASVEKTRRGLSPLAAVGSLVLVAALAGGGVWYALRGMEPAPTPIGTVMADLRTYDGSVVTVEGTVGNSVNLLGYMKIFELTDESGTITVVTERGLPSDGATVTVTGVVNQALKLGPIEKTVIMEPAETKAKD